MTRRSAFGLMAALLLVSTSCGETSITPEKRKELAYQAGNVAALTYLAVEKPTTDQAKAIKLVIDEITKSLGQYQEGGFKTALLKIKEAVAKAFPNEDQKATRLLADKLAETLLTELDELFERHPDWKVLGGEVAGIVASFTFGASKGFEDYLKQP
jgi:hypothetical protein